MIAIVQTWFGRQKLSCRQPLYALFSGGARQLSLSALAVAFITFAGVPVCAQDAIGTLPEYGQAAQLSYGGRLYDNHWVVLGRRPPEQPNSSYPANPRGASTTTWRCVSCHGWDYAGSNGHLGRIGSGFVDLTGMRRRKPDQIEKFLRSTSHQKLVAHMPDDALQAISLFLCCGQHDMKTLVNANGRAKGNPLRGKDIYEGSCSRCHQADGKASILGERGDASSLGWISSNRPAQAVHKIRNGVVGADMLSLRFLEMERIADLLAYLQSLNSD